MVSCLDCMRGFSQALLIIINSIVALLGLAVLILGIYVQVTGQVFFSVVNGVAVVGILLIVTGLFILIIGLLGVVGGIFASNLFGRITLALYAIILGLLILAEISLGIAAGVKKNDVNNFVRQSFQSTFNNTNMDVSETNAINTIELAFHCCGVDSYKDYRYLYGNLTVPASCCNANATGICNDIRMNVTDNSDYYIASDGCIPVIFDGINNYLGAIAGGAIVLGLIQIIGVVLACFVCIYKNRENKYEVV